MQNRAFNTKSVGAWGLAQIESGILQLVSLLCVETEGSAKSMCLGYSNIGCCCFRIFMCFPYVSVFRNRMTLMPSQAFYLLLHNKGIASMSLTMAQVYKEYRDEDGFLYMTYASQEMFGQCLNLTQGSFSAGGAGDFSGTKRFLYN